MTAADAMRSQMIHCFNNLGIIIAAGGSGTRYGDNNKLMEIIDGVPVFIHTVKTLYKSCLPNNFILVVPQHSEKLFRDKMSIFAPEVQAKIVIGGTARGESVWNGLRLLENSVEYVAVHDAARPLVTAELLSECLNAAIIYGGAIPGKPLADTLKKTDAAGCVVATINRDCLWRIETPQVFRTGLLVNAYRLAMKQGLDFTDDAGVMEYSGYQVKIVHNHRSNTKITTPNDLLSIKNDLKNICGC
jgi:2-C-methyl-D-erythritol 4-phosphate cytidylyltransferase